MKMNSQQLGEYFIQNKNEFMGEDGHNKLLIGLKQFVLPIHNENVMVVGIDVGACCGDYIPNIMDICKEPNKKILCFEPNPVNLSILELKINEMNDVKLFPFCISNETTIANFHNWKLSDHNGVGNQIAGLRSGGEIICSVDVKKLQDVLDVEYPNQDIIIKIIKIDTEGNDTNVIKGFEKYISKTQYIIFECSDCLDDERGPGINEPMKDIVDFLYSRGFHTYRIGTKKMFPVHNEYWNPIYEKEKFWSNCFSIQKDDPIIHKLVDMNFDYIF
jgi:FkbM family methyltransferase